MKTVVRIMKMNTVFKDHFNLEPIYTITVSLEPHNIGMLIIQRTLVTEQQYNRLIHSFKLSTHKHQGEINYGNSESKGFRLVANVATTDLIERTLELMMTMIFNLISTGIKIDDKTPVVPRHDLKYSLDTMKVFVDKKVPTAFLKTGDFMFDERSIIKWDRVNTETLLGSIVAINHNNIETDYDNDLFDQEDEGED